MAKNERTSRKVGSAAARILADPNSSPEEKSVAASALSQMPDREPDGTVRRLSHEGPSKETITMTKTQTAAEKAAAETNKEALKEVEKTAEGALKQSGDGNDTGDNAGNETGEQVNLNEGKGPDGEKLIDDADVSDKVYETLQPGDQERVVLTDHDPETDPPKDTIDGKIEKDQLVDTGDGRIRLGTGKVAYAPPGSYDAAKSGVAQDASGSFSNVNLPGGARMVDNEVRKNQVNHKLTGADGEGELGKQD